MCLCRLFSCVSFRFVFGKSDKNNRRCRWQYKMTNKLNRRFYTFYHCRRLVLGYSASSSSSLSHWARTHNTHKTHVHKFIYNTQTDSHTRRKYYSNVYSHAPRAQPFWICRILTTFNFNFIFILQCHTLQLCLSLSLSLLLIRSICFLIAWGWILCTLHTCVVHPFIHPYVFNI